MKSASIMPAGGQGLDYPNPSDATSSAQPPAATPDGCVNVPLASLAQPDDSEQMVSPEVGDTGTMQVDYEVVSISGDQACVKPSAINGKPLDGGEETPTPDDQSGGDEADSEGEDLRAQAQSMMPQ
ncbi:MAG TPA: hypothetical protein VK731_09550 [Candidatus Cybelea sp.]|nr:hypothetical protein [Candidatus Cybelea sp.]